MADKKYTDEQEQIARFAKAMGHPARILSCSFCSARKPVFLVIFTKNCL